MGEIKKNIKSFSELGIDVAAISTDSMKQSQAVSMEMALPFDLLCDPEKNVINAYHLLNPFEHGGIAKPAIFLILPSGEIAYRSLDGTARRVDTTDLLNYLKKHDKGKGGKGSSGAKKKWIIPSPKVSWQMARNLVLRGNFADWKHSLTFPYGWIKLSGKKISNAFSGKGTKKK